MRIAFVDTYYEEFLRTWKFQTEYGNYQGELNRLLEFGFGTADFYSREFRKIGWEMLDIVGNFRALLTRWAGDFCGDGKCVVLDQIYNFKPDVVFVQDLSFFTLRELKELSAKYLLVAQCSCALPEHTKVYPFHTIFTSFPHYVPKLHALGVNAVYMPLAFHESVLDWQDNLHDGVVVGRHPTQYVRDIDVSFVGGIGWQWVKGREVLEAVAREIPTFKWWGYGVEQLPADSPLRAKYQGTAWGRDMYRIYQRSKIVVNRHGEIAEGYANNMRMYEATGCGAVLVTERAKNNGELFDGGDIVEYGSPGEAVRQIKATLQIWEPLGRAFGERGQQTTLARHTYAHRIPKIAEVLEKALVAA